MKCVRTYVCPLETSQRKTQRVRDAIEEWQSIASHAADLMPGVPEWRWGDVNQNWLLYLAQDEHPRDEIGLRTHDRDQAYKKVSEALGSWLSNGKAGENPKGEFGHADYARFCHCGVSVEENDRGFGLKVGLEPYNSEWFHIHCGQYQHEYLEQVVSGDADTGSAELHMTDDTVTAHLTIKWEVSVPEPYETDSTLGIDVGERNIYTAAVVEGGDIKTVRCRNGQEFRHHRERLTARKDEFQRKGDKKAVLDISGERERYTEHVLHNCSREIVRMAEEHDCTIAIEDLTNYRKSTADPIHDWPYALLQEQIAYKARGAGVPVAVIDPHNTSNRCRKCGEESHRNRNGPEFDCITCGYTVDADVNAAVNIAQAL